MRWMTMQALSARRYLARRVTGLHGEGARVLMVFVRGLQVGRIPRGRQLPQRDVRVSLQADPLHGNRQCQAGLQARRIPRGRQLPQRRGLHSSTFQLNLSALHGIRVALIV
jgi:hypothetical protein